MHLSWCNSPHATAGGMGVVARTIGATAGGGCVAPTSQTTSAKNG